MKVAVLTSGGKDSLFSAYILASQGFEIRYMISIDPENPESYMFHYPNVRFVKDQCNNMNIQLVTKKTKGHKQTEIMDLKSAINSVKNEIDGVVSGAVSSEYQKQRIDMTCEELGLISFSPIWHKNPECLLREMVNAGFKIVITSIAAEGLGSNWLGKIIDERCITDLLDLKRKYGIHINGEGGEYETFILDMPLFKKPLEIGTANIKWDGISGIYDIHNLNIVK
jgi:ABC transporter with metal-binding/Fe-S-binding domain ATP-binding protein|tara:strand:- start:76 stop:750 length:675 start_codon:yes stop_codon:yes gene_type:complete